MPRFEFRKFVDGENPCDLSTVAMGVDAEFLADVVAEFQKFLVASGYVLDGSHLEVVPNDVDVSEDFGFGCHCDGYCSDCSEDYDEVQCVDDCEECPHYEDCYDDLEEIDDEDIDDTCYCASCMIERFNKSELAKKKTESYQITRSDGTVWDVTFMGGE